MSILLRIRHTIPFVKPFPLISLRKRWGEKLSVAKHSLGRGGAKRFGEDRGNLLLRFSADCEIASKGQIIQLPQDDMIFRHVEVFGSWGGIESDFLSFQIRQIENSGIDTEQIVFIDMGANVGLVSIQTMRKVPKGVRCIAVEPLPFLVQALEFNFASLVPYAKVQIVPYALGSISGVAEISVNPSNYGSSSLVSPVGDQSNSYVTSVNVMSSEDFAGNALRDNRKIVIKSDLEGFDCAVLASLPEWVWIKIAAGVVEVTSYNNADLSDLPKLLMRLGRYTRLSWEPDFKEPISIQEINAFWVSGESEIRNLYFAN